MRANKATKLLEKALPPQAQVALRGARAARGIVRFVRRRWPWIVGVALFVAVMVGSVLDAGTTTIAPTSADQARSHGAPAELRAAYQHTSRLWCHPASGAVWMAPADKSENGRDGADGWHRVDWRLVAAVGKVESGHASGRNTNALGDVWPWIIGPALDGSNPQYMVVADTDKGVWDLDASGDRAVGPMQILPATMAQFGVDANRDGMADPHNVWDAALTAARFLCLAGPDMREAIWAYNHSEEYVAAVVAEYLVLATSYGEDDFVGLPDGLPLGHAAVSEGLPLEHAPPMMAAVVTRWASLGGFDAEVEPHCVGISCAWVVDEAPEIVKTWEDALAGIGSQGPVAAEGKVLFSGDGARRWQLPELTAGAGLGWPVPVSPPPSAASPDIDGTVPATAVAPSWWAYHLLSSDPAWAVRTSTVAISTVKGAPVGWPSGGTAVPAADGCAAIVDNHGWKWVICGVDPLPLRNDTLGAGEMAGTATGNEIAVELFAPDGHRACPGEVFANWAEGMYLSPKEIDEYQTAQQEPQSGQEGSAQQEMGDVAEPVEGAHPIRECGSE